MQLRSGVPRKSVFAAHIRSAAFGTFRRTLQKPHGPEAGEHRHSQECRRLPARKRLSAAHKVFEVTGPDRVRKTFDLRCRLADVGTGDREVIVKFPGGPTYRVSQASDIVRAGGLLTVDGLLKLVRCL